MVESLRNKQGLNEEEFLAQYDVTRFERPSVTVDILLFTVRENEPENYRKLPEKVLQVLLVKRGDHPFIGQWALPGGFVMMKESLEDAALRELKTETNVDNIYLEQLYTWGDPNRDIRTRVISSSYMALVDSSNLRIKAGDDADDVRWFEVQQQKMEEEKTDTATGYNLTETYNLSLKAKGETLSATIRIVTTREGKVTKVAREILDVNGIAFDHAKIINYGIERLRNKLEYTDIAFNLMPEYFTLTELQQVYEIILAKPLLKANFRRKIADLVIETDQRTHDEGHRPAKLHRFNPDWQSNKQK